MKEFYLSEHSWACETSKSSKYCELNISKFLFYHNCEFFLLNYHSCIDGGDRYDWYVTLLNSLYKSKKVENYEITRGFQIERDFKELRLRDTIISKVLNEVNYLYRDMTGKSYGLVTEMKLSKYLLRDDELLKENLSKAIEYLKNKDAINYKCLIPELKELASMNYQGISEVETFKTTEYLIKKIKKHEASKQ